MGSGGNVVIPDGVTTIKKGTFRNCGNLSSITIPDSVTSIEDEAFEGCRKLVFHGTSSSEKLHSD